MKATRNWHTTPLGALVLWLGSIQLAVPVLVLTAAALAWGTYIDARAGSRAAMTIVYGSWWFIALMALICASLVFAVISRIPWQRRHTGFIIVHASLVALIAGGFLSLFGRIEGRIALEQGKTDSVLETNREMLELVEHQAGEFKVLASAPVPPRPGVLTLDGLSVKVTEHWNNCREEFQVLDSGTEPYRAVEIAFGPDAKSGVWIGDEAVGGPAMIEGIAVRVLAPAAQWQPPAPPTDATARYSFTFEGKQYPLGKVGETAFPGWTITAINELSHAKVSATAVADAPESEDNPAIDVTITDGKGSTERHTAFEKFPDMTFAKTLEGTTRSAARLASAGPTSAQESIVVYGDPAKLTVTHISATGEVKTLSHEGPLPWTFQSGNRSFTLLHDYSHALEVSHFVQSNESGDQRPAIVVSTAGDAAATMPLAWKGMIPAPSGGRNTLLRYVPMTVSLPFSLRLDEFRKTDYPGTEMAMAYESAVTVSGNSGPDYAATISMNEPLKQSGWKVYQSGFVGTTVSVFSVMRDPGLTLTYVACTALCIGIVITFYGRGHPGIPAPFARKEQHHVSSAVHPDPVPALDTVEPRTPVIAGVG